MGLLVHGYTELRYMKAAVSVFPNLQTGIAQ